MAAACSRSWPGISKSSAPRGGGCAKTCKSVGFLAFLSGIIQKALQGTELVGATIFVLLLFQKVMLNVSETSESTPESKAKQQDCCADCAKPHFLAAHGVNPRK